MMGSPQGLPSPGWIGPGEHLCLAFDHDEEREPVLAAFVSDGLAQGDQVIYHTDVTHPAVLTGLLRGWGVDPGRGAVPAPRSGAEPLRVRPTSDPCGLRVEGEVGTVTLPMFTAALREAAAREAGDVHLDVSGLVFIDLAGLRTIVDVAGGLAAPRSLVLSPASSHVHHLITMIGWDSAPGLRLSENDL
ncbi:hypothetical protein GCM10010517_80960 [Streptosporangium fragile]|uniref:STAS domain-containing protein n=1 Tax=Streptosporangium fragile TaxID=46186 RepID=A0ABP6IYS1_9ACTN